MALTDREREILDFENGWWRHRGSKEDAIRAQFDVSAIRYTQQLNQLLDRPEALAYSPTVVNRLRRVRSKGR